MAAGSLATSSAHSKASREHGDGEGEQLWKTRIKMRLRRYKRRRLRCRMPKQHGVPSGDGCAPVLAMRFIRVKRLFLKKVLPGTSLSGSAPHRTPCGL